MKRPCLTCGTPTANGSRCKRCTQRGYDSTWARLSRQVIAAEPWCHWPGGCEYPDTGTRTNPLTADHIRPKAAGGTDDTSNLEPLCRRHNSAKRDRHNPMRG